MLFDVAMLGACFAAFGFPVPPAGILLVAYLVGQLGNLIPIPGGIGGVDAGLIGTLVLYGVEPMEAIPAVIAYRAFVLWIPAAIGLPALASLRRRLATENHNIAACTPGQAVEVLGAGRVQTGALPAILSISGNGASDSAVCSHLDTIEVVDAPPDIAGCEECLAQGEHLEPPADVPIVRPHRLLRQLAEPARDRAPPARPATRSCARWSRARSGAGASSTRSRSSSSASSRLAAGPGHAQGELVERRERHLPVVDHERVLIEREAALVGVAAGIELREQRADEARRRVARARALLLSSPPLKFCWEKTMNVVSVTTRTP